MHVPALSATMHKARVNVSLACLYLQPGAHDVVPKRGESRRLADKTWAQALHFLK